jgi:hypothetical protein
MATHIEYVPVDLSMVKDYNQKEAKEAEEAERKARVEAWVLKLAGKVKQL